MSTPYPARPATGPSWIDGGRIPYLDGLRALAVLLVLFSHLPVPGGGWLPLGAVRGRCGFIGVQIFFVLSGFLITTLMLREVRQTGRLSVRGFYWRRLLRIAPAYVAFLAVLAALQACRWVHLNGRCWLALTSYTVNFLPGRIPPTISHVWSLSVEEHFYCLWPLLMAFVPPAHCRKAAMGCVAAALGLRWFIPLAFPGQSWPIDLWTFTRIDDIAVGCLLAFLANDPAGRGRLDWLTAGPRRLGLLAAAFLVSQFLCSTAAGGLLLPAFVVRVLVGLANDANSVTIALLLWVLLRRPAGACARALEYPAVRFLGVISYGLYLWHPLFLPTGPAWLYALPLNLVGMFAAALLSYFAVERPFLLLKDRRRHGRRRHAAPCRGRAGGPTPGAEGRSRPPLLSRTAPVTGDGERRPAGWPRVGARQTGFYDRTGPAADDPDEQETGPDGLGGDEGAHEAHAVRPRGQEDQDETEPGCCCGRRLEQVDVFL